MPLGYARQDTWVLRNIRSKAGVASITRLGKASMGTVKSRALNMWVPQPALTRKPVKGEAPGWAAKLCKENV